MFNAWEQSYKFDIFQPNNFNYYVYLKEYEFEYWQIADTVIRVRVTTIIIII